MIGLSDVLTSGPFAGLRRNHYRVIYMDPPWAFKTFTDNRAPYRGEKPYDVMTLDEIKLLPVADVAAKDACIIMWVLGSHLDQAIRLGEHFGFKYNTDLFYWVKTGKHDPDKRPISLGHWTRKQVEQALLFTRGKPSRVDKGVRQLIEEAVIAEALGLDGSVIYEPKREHSRKPETTVERIERLIDGPYLELFARRHRPGWHTWGLEVGKFDDPLRSVGNPFDDILGSSDSVSAFADLLG